MNKQLSLYFLLAAVLVCCKSEHSSKQQNELAQKQLPKVVQAIDCDSTIKVVLAPIKQILKIDAYHDTLSIVTGADIIWHPFGSGDSLAVVNPKFLRKDTTYTYHNKSIKAISIAIGPGFRLISADVANVSYPTPVKNKFIARREQAMLDFLLYRNTTYKAGPLAIGMTKDELARVLFKYASPELSKCLNRYNTFALYYPMEQYTEQFYHFKNGKLDFIHVRCL